MSCEGGSYSLVIVQKLSNGSGRRSVSMLPEGASVGRAMSYAGMEEGFQNKIYGASSTVYNIP